MRDVRPVLDVGAVFDVGIDAEKQRTRLPQVGEAGG
jgi:hypothetical protein